MDLGLWCPPPRNPEPSLLAQESSGDDDAWENSDDEAVDDVQQMFSDSDEEMKAA